jgi:hypothetical protein
MSPAVGEELVAVVVQGVVLGEGLGASAEAPAEAAQLELDDEAAFADQGGAFRKSFGYCLRHASTCVSGYPPV